LVSFATASNQVGKNATTATDNAIARVQKNEKNMDTPLLLKYQLSTGGLLASPPPGTPGVDMSDESKKEALQQKAQNRNEREAVPLEPSTRSSPKGCLVSVK
jgi:hypothetical protein